MFLRNKRLTAIVTLISMSQLACYNTYFISTTELAKLESDVEPREVVEIFGDCPEGTTAYRSVIDGTLWAEAPAEEGEAPVASDAVAAPAEPTIPTPPGCTMVPVSTANSLNVVTSDGGMHRVTPFNFAMSETNLVSAEYDLLLDMGEIRGAEVKEFSTWKTVATITGVTLVAVGTFVGISLLGEDEKGFSN